MHDSNNWNAFRALKVEIKRKVFSGSGVSFVQIRDLPGGLGEVCIQDESQNLVD
jgi:hypothetical protein